MYDTVVMFLENSYFPDDCINNAKEIIDKETGEKTLIGKLDNLRIKKNPNGSLVNGSLAKYYLGSNLFQLKRKDVKLAIEKISDSLKLPFQESKIYRLDWGANFILNKPLQFYYLCLGDKPRFIKNDLAKKGTLQYITDEEVLVFYNKLKEMKRSRQNIPETFIGKNVLRYEARIIKKVAMHMKLPEIKAKNLSEENFYRQGVNLWKDLYFSIHRDYPLKFDRESLPFLNSRKLLKAFAALIVKDVGVDKLLKLLDASKNSIKHREQYQRMKKLILELSNHPALTEPNEAIIELDKKIVEKAEEAYE